MEIVGVIVLIIVCSLSDRCGKNIDKNNQNKDSKQRTIVD